MRKWLVSAAALGMFLAVLRPGSADVAHAENSRDLKASNVLEVGSQYRRYRRGYRSRTYELRSPYYRPYAAPLKYYPSKAYSYAPYAGYAYPGLPQYLGGAGSRAYRFAPFVNLVVPGFNVWF